MCIHLISPRGPHAAEQQAKTDPLTDINNRQAFFFHGEQVLHYYERHELALSVLVIDIDHFKAINDSLGHIAVDVVLQRTGELFLKSFRRSDIYGRIGQEPGSGTDNRHAFRIRDLTHPVRAAVDGAR